MNGKVFGMMKKMQLGVLAVVMVIGLAACSDQGLEKDAALQEEAGKVPMAANVRGEDENILTTDDRASERANASEESGTKETFPEKITTSQPEETADSQPEIVSETAETGICQKGSVNGREYSLTIDLTKWEGYTSEAQIEVIGNLFWEVYPRMYERFGVLSNAPVDVTIAIEAEGYEIAWADGDFIHLRDEWLGTYKEDYDCLTHELAHVIQNGWDGEYLGYDAFIERFADYCRFLYAYQNGKYNDAVWTLQTVRDESSIETSVRFLVWLDFALAYQKDVMRDYFVICTERKYPAAEWDQAWQEIFRGTWLEGKSVEEAWECFAASDFAMLSSVRNGDGPSELLREYDVRTKLLGSR